MSVANAILSSGKREYNYDHESTWKTTISNYNFVRIASLAFTATLDQSIDRNKFGIKELNERGAALNSNMYTEM